MNNGTYEPIHHEAGLPCTLFLHRAAWTPRHWHEDLEVLLVVEGEVRIVYDTTEVRLAAGEVAVIGTDRIHHIEADGKNLALALQVDPEFFEPLEPEFSRLTFPERPFADDARGLEALRRTLVEAAFVLRDRKPGAALAVVERLYRLAAQLLPVGVPGSAPVRDARLREVIAFIEANAAQEIGLTEVADHTRLQSEYLSRWFSKQMGITLIKYIASIRVKNALPRLGTTDDPITQIALDCGFPSLKSFYAAFHEHCGTTPNDYRKRAARGSGVAEGARYMHLDEGPAWTALREWAQGRRDDGPSRPRTTEVRDIVLDGEADRGPVPREALRLGAFGRAAEALRPEWRAQFTRYVAEIGCDAVRFHGLFADEMVVARREPDGALTFGFGLVDQVIDFLLNLGVRPFVELGPMPGPLARDPSATLFSWGAGVSPPRDLDEWTALVRAFLDHAAGRWGRDEVAGWKFEVWNEPDLPGAFWRGTAAEFHALWSATWKALKGFDPRILVGGCGFSPWGVLLSSWVEEFASYCQQTLVMPDFVSYHVYPVSLVDFDALAPDWASLGPEALTALLSAEGARRGGAPESRNQFQALGARLDRTALGPLPRYVTEWNYSPDSRDLLHDTRYCATFVLEGLTSCAPAVSALAWWVFSDIFEEFGPGPGEFHGGFGLMNRSGLPKPAWWAWKWFRALEGRVIGRGEGWLATRSPSGLQILAWHHQEFTEAWSRLDPTGVSVQRRDGAFVPVPPRSLRFRLPPGAWSAQVSLVSSQQGSAFEAWSRAGAPETLTDEARGFLLGASEPRWSRQALEAPVLELELEPHDFALVRLTAQPT